jgi:hypothetical protein
VTKYMNLGAAGYMNCARFSSMRFENPEECDFHSVICSIH